jgi:putative sigma-54 modulation protein
MARGQAADLVQGGAFMRIDVVGRKVDVTEAIREYAESKAVKLPKYYDGVQQITFTLTKQNHQASATFDAELVLDVRGHEDFISHASDTDLYAAIDLVCEKGERQLREFKEQLKNGKH